MFTNVAARWPGSTHDSRVFRTSNICTYLQNNHCSLDDGILLGDSGYARSPFLMTPYTTTQSAPQEAYNDAHAKTRVVIEQTFGRWKRRFHVLLSEIRMAPEKVCMIVGACAVLHNIALQLHEPMEDEEVDELADVDPYHGPQQGLSLRDIFWLRFSHAVLNSVLKFIIIGATFKSAPVIIKNVLLFLFSLDQFQFFIWQKWIEPFSGPQFQKSS